MHSKLDIIKDILFFFITVAAAFGYVLLVLLIISFCTSSFLHFRIEKMMAASGVCAVLWGIYYIYKHVKKYKKQD